MSRTPNAAQPVVVAGALTVLTGMLPFAVIVYRARGRAAARTIAESSG